MKTKIFKAFINNPNTKENLDDLINKFMVDNKATLVSVVPLCPVAESVVDSKTTKMFVLAIYKEGVE